jgi:shikimate dehydrogenase
MNIPYAEVIGDPVSHSKSPLIHKFWLAKLGIEADYRSTHVLPEQLEQFVAGRIADKNWRGCNVTIPHKIAVMDHVADPGNVRASIGAMNTLAWAEDNTVIGTNTDAAGFYAPIAELELEDAQVAVIGSGGAARAVLFALARCNVGEVVLLVRNPLKGAGLLAHFGLKGVVQKLDAPLPPVTLLVNATSLGMVGQPPLVVDLAPLPKDAVVYDLVYAPLLTPLLAAAEKRKLGTVDGLEMLVGQAAFAFELFFGAPPPRECDDELRALLTA